MVGHDDEGQASCFMGEGFELVRLLRTIRSARALEYRPVFIFFDLKPGDEGFTGDRLQLGLDVPNEALAGNFVLLRQVVDENGGRFPTVKNLAGKVVVYFCGQSIR